MTRRSIFVIVTLAACSVLALGSKKTDRADAPPNVKLELSVPKATFTVGEQISIRLELHNLGKEDFFVGRFLDDEAFTSPSHIALHVLDAKGLGGGESASTYLTPDTIASWWRAIPPAHFYGVEISRGGPNDGVLTKPGKYSLQADYISDGGETPAIPSEHLPSYSVWRGNISSNKITIELTTQP